MKARTEEIETEEGSPAVATLLPNYEREATQRLVQITLEICQEEIEDDEE